VFHFYVLGRSRHSALENGELVSRHKPSKRWVNYNCF
jgi:hypothetical protein